MRTVTYKFKVNGEYTYTVVPGRGLRQGDPISPYLFLLCAEGFSTLLHQAELAGRLRGIRISPQAPTVNHLLFADDALLLFEADHDGAEEINAILQVYEAMSGQVINREKSSILFSRNTNRQKKEEIMQLLGLSTETSDGKYMGLPMYIGKSRSKCFSYLKERIWARIQGWKERFLSKAGKEILLKAVAQAIPTYAMSCFDLTKGLCDDISTMICRYWWSQQEDENRMHWVGWDKMKLPKEQGGMGFRDLYSFNLAMLSRQVWRLLQVPDSLCSRVLRAKYYPNGDILSAVPVAGMSYVWRSILNGVKIIKEGMIWRVRSGENINMWNDPWIPSEQSRKPSSLQGQNVITRVSELIDPVNNIWDEQLVRQTFSQFDAEVILRIPICE
jgi:hypothetical protein